MAWLVVRAAALGGDMVRAPRSPWLKGLVELMWTAGPSRSLSAAEWTLPSGRVHMVFRSCGRPLYIDDRPARRGWQVAGVRARSMLRDTPAGARSVGLTVVPWACELLFGVPAHALGGEHVDLSELWGDRAVRLEDRVIRGAAEETLDAVEAALVGAVAGRRLAPRIVSIAEGLESGGTLSAVAASVGLGVRRTRDLCRVSVGLSPRDVRRVARLQGVLADVGAAPERAWGDRAYLCGYADQAHLSREFKALTGFTPTAYGPRPGQPSHVPVPNRSSAHGRDR